jgi:uncharacterized protein (TIGR02246 family)
MKTIGLITVSGLALFLGGCDSSPAVNKVAVEKSVTDVEKSILKAANDKDAAAFASHYTADAVFMSSGQAPLKGAEAIAAGMKSMMADPNLKLDFASDRVDVADAGDMVATRGSYTLSVSDPNTKQPVNDHGSYVTVFRKQADGSWKAALDIITSEVAPPAAAPKPEPRKGAKAVEKKKKGKKK